ncbi:hypothetical protein ACHAXT_003452 [Thalassiosira profunda]
MEKAAGGIAGALSMLENYDVNSDTRRDKEVVMRESDATFGCEKGLVEFYRGRIHCSCLDGLWAQVRSQQRTSLCPQCYERKPRSTFFICTGCESQQYCSEACAVAGWPGHKETCKGIREYRKQHAQTHGAHFPRLRVLDGGASARTPGNEHAHADSRHLRRLRGGMMEHLASAYLMTVVELKNGGEQSEDLEAALGEMQDMLDNAIGIARRITTDGEPVGDEEWRTETDAAREAGKQHHSEWKNRMENGITRGGGGGGCRGNDHRRRR